MRTKVKDPSTMIGILLAVTFVLVAASFGSGGLSVSRLYSFVDVPSVLIVLLGTTAVVTACFSFKEVLHTQQLIVRTVFYREEDYAASVLRCLELAEIARK